MFLLRMAANFTNALIGETSNLSSSEKDYNVPR